MDSNAVMVHWSVKGDAADDGAAQELIRRRAETPVVPSDYRVKTAQGSPQGALKIHVSSVMRVDAVIRGRLH